MASTVYPQHRMDVVPQQVPYALPTQYAELGYQDPPHGYNMFNKIQRPGMDIRSPAPCGSRPPHDTGYPPKDHSVVFHGATSSALSTYRAEVMQAAQKRDVTRLKIMVTTLIRQHHLTAKELDMCLVLHHVVWTDELTDTAQFLISFGCDPYYPDMHGDTVFHYTVLNNNHFNLFLTGVAECSDERSHDILSILEWLYLNGCSIETQDAHGKTGLMWASQRGSLALVQWLLSRGANLAHRDHNGRTVLQMACLSGDEDTIRTICEVGAITLLDCESIDDPGSNTAVKICWQRGYFFLALSLRQWNLQKRLFGTMQLFRSSYALYYWALVITNFVIFLYAVRATAYSHPMFCRALSRTLVQHHYEYWYHSFVFLVLYSAAQVFWLIAFKSDPGYVKSNVIPDQSYRCTPDFRFNLSQRPVFGYRVTSACYKLQLLERDLAWISAELTALNWNFGVRYDSNAQLPVDAERNFEQCVLKIHTIRQQVYGFMERVGQERRALCPLGYADQVLQGCPKRICITCRIMKPFRAHHCGDCAHCIHRFDHHCIWVDNCIGIGNQRSFFLFLLCLSSSIAYFWYLVGVYYTSHVKSKPDDVLDLFTEPLFYVALTNSLCNLLWAGFVGYLFGRTLKSMCTNITFYEYLKKPPHIQHRFKGHVYAFFWDLQDSTLIKLVRNIFSFWSLDSRFDKEDYQQYLDESPTELYNPVKNQAYERSPLNYTYDLNTDPSLSPLLYSPHSKEYHAAHPSMSSVPQPFPPSRVPIYHEYTYGNQAAPLPVHDTCKSPAMGANDYDNQSDLSTSPTANQWISQSQQEEIMEIRGS